MFAVVAADLAADNERLSLGDWMVRSPVWWRRRMMGGILILFLLPLAVRAALYAGKDRPASFDDADCSSIGMLPPADADRDDPSCLISCSHRSPEGSLSVLVGRHGAMKPAGKVRCGMWAK
jgi:hypothetical protein